MGLSGQNDRLKYALQKVVDCCGGFLYTNKDGLWMEIEFLTEYNSIMRIGDLTV